MKRIITIIICTMLAAVLVACGASGVNAKTRNYAEDALAIVEKYNSADISAEDASSRLESIKSGISSLDLSDDVEDISNRELESMVATAALTIRSGGDSYSIEDRLREFLK